MDGVWKEKQGPWPGWGSVSDGAATEHEDLSGKSRTHMVDRKEQTSTSRPLTSPVMHLHTGRQRINKFKRKTKTPK